MDNIYIITFHFFCFYLVRVLSFPDNAIAKIEQSYMKNVKKYGGLRESSVSFGVYVGFSRYLVQAWRWQLS